MRALKIYLWVVTTLLVIALLSGVYVWFVFQNFNKDMMQPISDVQTIPVNDADTEEPISQKTDTTESDRLPAATATVTIPVSTLTDTQRSILATFGVDENSFTVTPAMVQCAKEAVGEDRFAELLDGGTPTARESFVLLPCIQ